MITIFSTYTLWYMREYDATDRQPNETGCYLILHWVIINMHDIILCWLTGNSFYYIKLTVNKWVWLTFGEPLHRVVRVVCVWQFCNCTNECNTINAPQVILCYSFFLHTQCWCPHMICLPAVLGCSSLNIRLWRHLSFVDNLHNILILIHFQLISRYWNHHRPKVDLWY